MRVIKSKKFWIGILFSAVCLWLALKDVPFIELKDSIIQANYIWLLPAVAFQFFSILVRALRWTVLLRVKSHFVDSFWATNIGYLFTNVFPMRLGEVARVVIMSESCTRPFVEVAGTALIERLLDVSTMVLVLILILTFMQVPEIILKSGLIFLTIVLLGFLVVLLLGRFRKFSVHLLEQILSRFSKLPSQKITGWWINLVDGLEVITHLKGGSISIALSFVTWFFSITVYWCVLKAFTPSARLLEAAFMVVCLSFAVSVPSSPGFVGVFQYVGQQALVLPFGSKYNSTTALAITLTAYLVYYLFTTFLGVVAVWKVDQSISSIRNKITEAIKASRSSLPNKDFE